MRISDWSSDVCSSDLDQPLWRSFDQYAALCRAFPALYHGFDRSSGHQQFRGRTAGAYRRLSGGELGRIRVHDRHHSGRCVYALRSEEHTSELQSLMRISYAVFCLKKKKYNITLDDKTTYI